MRVLKTASDIDFSCGIYRLTGFGNSAEGERLDSILADLKDCDGFCNRYIEYDNAWCYEKHKWITEAREAVSPRCAMFIVSLNARQCEFWRPILLEYGYVEVTKPIRNPNSGNRITVFIRQRKSRPRKSKKKEEVKR